MLPPLAAVRHVLMARSDAYLEDDLVIQDARR